MDGQPTMNMTGNGAATGTPPPPTQSSQATALAPPAAGAGATTASGSAPGVYTDGKGASAGAGTDRVDAGSEDDWKEELTKPAPDERYRTEDVTQTKGNDFEDYFLKRELLMGIYEKGFERPSPIQEEAIPIVLQGRNLLARAKNGTGKTAAFIIPCIEKTDVKRSYIQVLILVPTRELALQTSAIVKEIGKHTGVQCMVTTGGTTLKDDIMRLYNVVHILVGTPGRVLDLADKGIANLKECNTLIMDETCSSSWCAKDVDRP